MRNLSKLGIPLFAIGMVIFLPILLPIGLISHGIYLLRLRAAANRFKCVGCGQILGRKSIELADDEWARHMRELMDRNPGVRLRVVRNLHAICPNCGKQYQFDEKTRTFIEHLPSS
jgi:predicted RNA-binding Zn-ribbon protein involved in translation (DUF1610 family)